MRAIQSEEKTIQTKWLRFAKDELDQIAGNWLDKEGGEGKRETAIFRLVYILIIIAIANP